MNIGWHEICMMTYIDYCINKPAEATEIIRADEFSFNVLNGFWAESLQPQHRETDIWLTLMWEVFDQRNNISLLSLSPLIRLPNIIRMRITGQSYQSSLFHIRLSSFTIGHVRRSVISWRHEHNRLHSHNEFIRWFPIYGATVSIFTIEIRAGFEASREATPRNISQITISIIASTRRIRHTFIEPLQPRPYPHRYQHCIFRQEWYVSHWFVHRNISSRTKVPTDTSLSTENSRTVSRYSFRCISAEMRLTSYFTTHCSIFHRRECSQCFWMPMHITVGRRHQWQQPEIMAYRHITPRWQWYQTAETTYIAYVTVSQVIRMPNLESHISEPVTARFHTHLLRIAAHFMRLHVRCFKNGTLQHVTSFFYFISTETPRDCAEYRSFNSREGTGQWYQWDFCNEPQYRLLQTK